MAIVSFFSSYAIIVCSNQHVWILHIWIFFLGQQESARLPDLVLCSVAFVKEGR